MESKELKTPIKIRLKMKIHNVDPLYIVNGRSCTKSIDIIQAKE